MKCNILENRIVAKSWMKDECSFFLTAEFRSGQGALMIFVKLKGTCSRIKTMNSRKRLAWVLRSCKMRLPSRLLFSHCGFCTYWTNEMCWCLFFTAKPSHYCPWVPLCVLFSCLVQRRLCAAERRDANWVIYMMQNRVRLDRIFSGHLCFFYRVSAGF